MIYLAGVIVLYSCLIFFCRFFPAFKTSRDLASKGSWAQIIHCIKKRIKIMSFPWAVISLARVIVLYCFSWFFSGFSLHSRLLEISDSLSLEEVKKIKFLVKSKVSGFRLARITEAFELFEELETNGVFPCHYIANLLAGIQRYDLVEKLGIQLPLTAAKHGNNENP